MDDKKLYEAFQAYVDAVSEQQQQLAEIYPEDVPNEASKHAVIQGYCIENSFGPHVGEYNDLCRIGYEKLCIWTHTKNTDSVLVSEIDLAVKQQPFWKTAAHLILLSYYFARSFECATANDVPAYKWMYYFDPSKAKIKDIVFHNLSELDREFISTGLGIKATDLARLAPIIELLNRDDKAYTSMSLLFTAFCVHPCCLICEMSKYPWHDHLAEEPKIWDHAVILPSLEIAVVQSCRAVEAIIGEPPNQGNQGKVHAYKQRWNRIFGIDPDDTFEKAKMTYLEFYYNLFHDLRNPSAHSRGNIHFDLARKRAVEAQCFADDLLNRYVKLNAKEHETALGLLQFNRELLDRVSEDMSTSMTK